MKQESEFNRILGNAIESTDYRLNGRVYVEETDMLKESKGMRPDILLDIEGYPPVIIETSYLRGDADRDAIARLGKQYKKNGDVVRTTISVELEEKYRKIKKLKINNILHYALHQKTPDGNFRFPNTGFMVGTYADISRLVTSTSIPKEELERVGDEVASKVKEAAMKLKDAIPQDRLVKVSNTLYQRSVLNGLQTTAILWLDAFTVQRKLMHYYDISKPSDVPNDCVSSWKKLLKINWKPIFGPAVQVLDEIKSEAPGPVHESLERLLEAADLMDRTKTGMDINIGAELFPKLSSDRKAVAAFYTQAHNAEFLAAMTITEDLTDWSNPSLFENFKICDMACGTGTLLRFAYIQIESYHQMSAGRKKDPAKLHKNAMERGLYGVDVSPIAAHLTSAGLAMRSMNPYSLSNIGWVAVGDMRENKTRKPKKRELDAIKTGSIEYMKADAVADMAYGMFGHSTGTETLDEHFQSVTIKNNAFDVILMNPPYSRTRGGQSAFDISGLTEEERRMCQDKWGELIKGEQCVKTAGMAATYLCMAKKKIKPGGRIGFVLPRTAANAETWKVTRNMIETEFEDITVVVVQSGNAIGKNAISADTKMEEMFLIARMKDEPDGKRSDVRCVTLYEPILRLGVAAEIAKAIKNAPNDGVVKIGTEIGVSIMFKTSNGVSWSSVGVVADSMACIKTGLLNGEIIDVSGNKIGEIPMTKIEDLFEVGPTHDIIGHLDGRDNRGALTFNEVRNESDSLGMYRSLWSVNSKIQTTITTHATHKGTIYREKKAQIMWDRRSNLFISRGVRWTAQKLVAAMTENEVMGGRSWTCLKHNDINVMKAFALWANSIYGMITYWANGSRAQTGRSTLQIKAIKNIQCPDFPKLGKEKLEAAAKEFDILSKETLLITNQAFEDDDRNKINDAVSSTLR